MTTIFCAELFPQNLTASQHKLSTKSQHIPVLRRRSYFYGEPIFRNYVYHSLKAVNVSSEIIPSYHEFKEGHFMKLIHRSLKARNYDEGLYLLKCMVNAGHRVDVILCTKLIKAFFSSKNPDKAFKVMRILEKFGEPDIYAYNAFISGLCKSNRINTANEVLGRMRARGLSPDIVTYNIMIGSLCNRGKLDMALKMIQDNNCRPTVITYTILIEATILEKGIDDAMNLLDEMLANGLQPDMYTYNTILRGMCRQGLTDEALTFLRSLKARGGFEPDVISYNIVLRSLLNRGEWAKGEKLMVEMFSAGCEPNVVTYSILISSLCRFGFLEEAINALKIMTDEGLRPDTYTYDPLISMLCKEGRLELAIALLDHMVSSGCLPDIVNYNTILLALCKNGKPGPALEVFGKLAENGCPPDVSTYNTMVGALWSVGDRAGALGLVEDMIRKGIEPDAITYNSLVSCLCRDGLVDRALELLEDMKSHGELVPTVITYNIMVLGLCKSRRIDTAVSVLEEMVRDGCMPNETTYVLLVEGIGFAGWRVEAVELAKELNGKGAISDHAMRRLNQLFPVHDVYEGFYRTEIKVE